MDETVIHGSTHVWMDHDTFTDGDHPDSTLPSYYGRIHQQHDGELDIVKGADYVTASWNVFEDHDKTILIGFVFAPSTAAANPRGYLVTRGRVTSEAPGAAYKLARPWVPGSDPTARPMLTIRDTWLGPGIDAVAPYANMRDAYPWQSMRFREYRDNGPGAEITVPENRPQLTSAQAESATRAAYLGDWAPWREC
ncbi:hypothetical protein [Streptomyces flaveolus]|uniref:pectate lyase family protein n=1 Tax=Streptomyces flaveolus TaxID=67297 RepID=UPI0033ED958C